MMKKALIIFGIVIIIAAIIIFFRNMTGGGSIGLFNRPDATAQIGDVALELEVARTTIERQEGLSNRDSLPENRGMLFIFDKPDYYSFWMKNMKFPIDIIFINGERVVTIHKNVKPQAAVSNSLPLYGSKEPADKVLEINAFKSDDLDIKEGDTISLSL